jgi:4-oxalocrotonate tautomerase
LQSTFDIGMQIPIECVANFIGGIMPFVQVTWVAGRTPEQKRKLAERITLALIEDGRAKRENIQTTFVDLPSTDYAEAGVTVADQKRTP